MSDTLMLIIAFIVGTMLPLLFGTFLPNTKFHAWGVKLGKKFSAKGNTFVPGYEQLENNLTGSFLAFAQGFKEGADSDDA